MQWAYRLSREFPREIFQMAGMPFSPCDTTDGASSCSDASVGVLKAVFGPVIDALAQGNDPETVTASSKETL
ncbi:IncI1 plasmid conjugative transfer integral membrane protein TraY, partial [Pseudomonas ficuserectae]